MSKTVSLPDRLVRELGERDETFSLSLLSGLDQTFPDPPTTATGEVTVNIDPPEIGGWRFAGERQWRLSGEIVGNLGSGDRLIEFRPVPGYINPPTQPVGLTSSEPKRVLEATCSDCPQLAAQVP